MKYVKSLDIQKIAFIDIETVRKVEHFKDLDKQGQEAWKYKMKNNNTIPPLKDLKSSWTNSASLYAEFSTVVAVGIGYEHGGQFKLKTLSNNNEVDLLQEVYALFESLQGSKFTLCGHSAKYFDYPFLSKRYLAQGMKVPSILDVCGMKPWDLKLLDTNELYKSGYTGPGSSLTALCYSLGVPTPKTSFDGSQVGEEYYKGNLSQIEEYVGRDVLATYNVFKRFRGEGFINYEDVVFSGVEQKEHSILETILNTKEISDRVKDRVAELFESGKVDEGDRDNVVKMISAVYLKTTDRVGVKKQKEQEVIDFIDTVKGHQQG